MVGVIRMVHPLVTLGLMAQQVDNIKLRRKKSERAKCFEKDWGSVHCEVCSFFSICKRESD